MAISGRSRARGKQTSLYGWQIGALTKQRSVRGQQSGGFFKQACAAY